MTGNTLTATPPMDEELLIREAARLRQSRRSGRYLAGLAGLAVFLAAVGYLMAFHPGAITYSSPYSSPFPLGAVLAFFGVLALLGAVIAVLGAVSGARRGAPWGDPAPGDCPECGHPSLRQDDVVRWEGSNTLKPAARGTVTLCETSDCGYATAQPDPR